MNAVYAEQLEKRKAQNRLRSLKSIVPLSGPEVSFNGKILINFCSNDYLGLAQHPLLKERAIQYIQKYGVGSTASRLICGNHFYIEEIENKLARLKGTESSLIFSSGYQANVSILSTLFNSDSIIFADHKCHNSLLQGALISGAKLLRFRHNDLKHLQSLLSKANKNSQKVIITESIFSVDGDIAPLTELIELAKANDAQIFLDEAHATGVFGSNGMGFSVDYRDIDFVMGTFSKGCGSSGGYFACSQAIKDYLINFCSGIIYTTAPPPPVMGSIDAAIDLIPQLSVERKLLLDKANEIRASLLGKGYDIGNSTTHIIPIVVGSEQNALNLASHLEENGLLVMPIRPPTVAEGQSALRISLSTLHSKEHIEKLLKHV